MTSKYDRNIEELERARIEEGRIWSQRIPEGATGPYGTGAVVGYGEPMWAAISRASAPVYTHPLYGPQVPLSLTQQTMPVPFPGAFAGQPFGSLQGQPVAFQGGLSQPSIPSGIPQQMQQQFHPLSGLPLYQNPYLFSPLPGTFPQHMMNLYGQPVLAGASFHPYQTINPQQQYSGPFESPWQFGAARQASRAFSRAPRGYKRSDELIRDEICKRLALTPEIDATDVDVIVKDGEVTLKGVVDDRVAKRIAEDITETTFGVRDVLNDIRIGSRFAEQETFGTTKGKEK